MGYVGAKPSAVPLTSADITDGIIVNADIASGAAIALTKLASTGTLTVDNIQFPATAVASANANTLDDYEEGNFGGNTSNALFVPVTSGTITMSRGNMAYTKIGRVCNIRGEIEVSTVSSPVGGTNINLPFTAATSSVDRNVYGAARVLTYNVTLTGTGLYIFLGSDGGTTAQLVFERSGTTLASYTAAAGHIMWIDFDYLTA